MNYALELTLPKAIAKIVKLDIVDRVILEQIHEISLDIEIRRTALQTLLSTGKIQFTEKEREPLLQAMNTAYTLETISTNFFLERMSQKLYNIILSLDILPSIFEEKLKRSHTQIIQSTLRFKTTLSELSGLYTQLLEQVLAKK